MTGQLDLTVWQRTEPITVAHHQPLRALDPRRDVVERAWPALQGLSYLSEHLGLQVVPLSAAKDRDVAAVFLDDDMVSAAQCDVCGSPVSKVLRSSDPDVYDADQKLLAPDVAALFAERWMRVEPCGHSSGDVALGGCLVRVSADLTVPPQVTDWLYTWASYYATSIPDPFDAANSPPALFESDGTVLGVWQG